MIPLKDYQRSKTFPVFNTLFILINTGVFMYLVFLPGPDSMQFTLTYAFTPERFLAAPLSEWRTLFTALFLHGGFIHFFGNMLFLFIFGDNVEDALGHFRYLFFYIGAGVFAGIAQGLLAASLATPNIGASGSIAAVLGAYIVLYPTARVLTLVPIGFFLMSAKLPAFVFLGVWALLQFFSGLMTVTGGAFDNVGYFAHIGGFIFGLLVAAVGRAKYLEKFRRQRRVFYGNYS